MLREPKSDPSIYPISLPSNFLHQLFHDYAEDATVIIEFLGKCDGHQSLSQVLNTFNKGKQAIVMKWLVSLLKSGTIRDVRVLYQVLDEVASNPPLAPPAFLEAEVNTWPFFRPLCLGEESFVDNNKESENEHWFSRQSASMESLIKNGNSENLRNNLMNCLRRAYRLSSHRRTVGSAGALYPVVTYVAFPAGANEFSTYTFLWYDPLSSHFFKIDDQPLSEVATAFSPDPLVQQLLKAGIGLIFICCDPSRTCSKYGNRGYRFMLMEAGAVWQNIDLAANSLGMPARAFGGFVDEQCSRLMALPDHVHPYLVVFLGS